MWFRSDQDLWGEDAHEFKPDRWMDGAMGNRKLPGIGVYSHLCAFFPMRSSIFIHILAFITEWLSPVAPGRAWDGALRTIPYFVRNKEHH